MKITIASFPGCGKPKYLKRSAIVIFLTIFVFLAGCGSVSERTVTEVLEKDPSFGKLLDARESISVNILLLKDGYKGQKDSALKKIESLKEDLRSKKEKRDTKIAALKNKLAPEILNLKGELENVHSLYKLRKKDLKLSLSKLKSIRKLLDKKGELALSGDEISIWNKRISDLEKAITALRTRLDKLKAKVRLIKTEIKILEE